MKTVAYLLRQAAPGGDENGNRQSRRFHPGKHPDGFFIPFHKKYFSGNITGRQVLAAVIN